MIPKLLGMWRQKEKCWFSRASWGYNGDSYKQLLFFFVFPSILGTHTKHVGHANPHIINSVIKFQSHTQLFPVTYLVEYVQGLHKGHDDLTLSSPSSNL
jgi:hypothetical protein